MRKFGHLAVPSKKENKEIEWSRVICLINHVIQISEEVWASRHWLMVIKKGNRRIEWSRVTCFIDHVIQINEGVWTLKKETEELSRVE
jgi:hypothetical protein